MTQATVDQKPRSRLSAVHPVVIPGVLQCPLQKKHVSSSICIYLYNIYIFIFIYFSSSCCTHLKLKFHVGLLNGLTREAVVRLSCLAVVIYLDISRISPQETVPIWIAAKQTKQGFWKSQLRELNGNKF